MFARRTDWNLRPNRLTKALQEAQRGGAKILDLTISNPTRVGIEYNQSAILDALGDRKALDYDPQPQGLASAREAVAAYYSNAGDPERIFLTTGTSEAYSFLFRLLSDPGGEMLVPKPSYPLFDFLADLDHIKLVPYALVYDHLWQIDFPSFNQALGEKARAVVLVHPNNPTGSFVSAQERLELNAICRRRRLALIVDEVFLDYGHDGETRPTFAANDEVLTFTLSGISKVSALPQMKLGWIAVSGPPSDRTPACERLEVIADTYLSMNAPVQLAAPVLLEQRRIVQPQLMRRIRANLGELDRQLGRQKSCSRLEVEGGWYAVLRVPAVRSDEDFAVELVRAHSVLVHPGHFYDFASDGYLVLSLITPQEEFRVALEHLLEFANQT
ncbi:MAG: pyridoxal phosphate-dependent aminotransferase [Acidobacteria bacterium]|nr:pyridoxal phosphate-dependent aminotransferase [Acidobacteriota bacterium]